MRRVLFTASILALALLSSSTGFSKDKTVKITTPLSADEIAIYRAVLQQYTSKKPGNLNVSAATFPLDPNSPTTGLGGPECLKDTQLQNLPSLSHSFHDLPPDVLVVKTMMLVDPKKQVKLVHSNDPSNTIRKGKPVAKAVNEAFATGLFSMSEIAFDKDHRFGVVSYHFWCGFLCGNGSTVVFEKVDGEWRNANRRCGGWIS